MTIYVAENYKEPSISKQEAVKSTGTMVQDCTTHRGNESKDHPFLQSGIHQILQQVVSPGIIMSLFPSNLQADLKPTLSSFGEINRLWEPFQGITPVFYLRPLT